MSMGQFISVKQDMMVLFTFDGEPVLARGKNFKKEEVDELQFPATFYDIREVKDRYAEGEPLEIIRKGKGESKVFPVQGGPKLRCIMEEDAIEPIVGRTFIMSHTGNATNTVYKLREVLVPKKPRAQRLPVADEEEEEAEAIPEKAAQDKAREKKMRTPGDDPLETDAERAAKVDAKVKAPATKRRASKATITVPEEDNESIAPKFDSEGHVLPEGKSDEEDTEKAKFMKEVAKRTAKRTKKPVAQDPPDEPDLEQEEEPDQEEE
jgi:hypothetical protein